ncbi:hypothetical protein PTSG_12984 [Salpingoeca rosetta]|uniref:Transcription elongation factor SPT5 n=1 Tax=Salpingoeca rosetta (strain ATCC 50818 / BSB-021) TaxID=946362 RepID=F2UPD0_SALR5|nr:uncharacterized protein PTSG_12984 [Salpingoeca rosetta]EGD79485.1 hypothetical protein PTSG_12984 [Salpingoeca rosetta]|eukprot:XP_004988966.1 hypothetical protein PTSG_12984 [Salpingoeca rosetta]
MSDPRAVLSSDEEDEVPETQAPMSNGSKNKKAGEGGGSLLADYRDDDYGDDEDEDEDADMDEDDEDEDDYDDDEDDYASAKRRKNTGGRRPRKRKKASGRDFIDEAEVGDEEEEVDDDEAELHMPETAYDRMAEKHWATTQQKRQQRGDVLAEMEKRYREQAQRYEEASAVSQGAGAAMAEDLDDFIERDEEPGAMMGEEEAGISLAEPEIQPTKDDPIVWAVRCKPGGEQEAAIKLMRKAMQAAMKGEPLAIKSVIGYRQQRVVGGRSYIYVEAYSREHVKHAIAGIEELVYGQWTQELVEMEARPALLRVKKRKINVKPNQWVRIKRGIYANDLAKVVRVNATVDPPRVEVHLVPRIDLTPQRRKKNARKFRPPQRLFNRDEIDQAIPDAEVMWDSLRDEYRFENNAYTESGFLIKRIPISGVLTSAIKPTLEELSMFEMTEDAHVEMELPDEPSLQPAFAVGDRVEVVGGDLKNLTGEILSINASSQQVEIRPDSDELKKTGITRIPLPISEVRKAFHMGDQVKVNHGRYKGETGLVLRVTDDFVSVLSDLSLKEIRVLASDLEMTTTVASGRDVLGQFRLHDLVQFNNANVVGCIIRIENEQLKILDQRGQERDVRPQEVRPRQRRGSPQALDKHQNVIGTGLSVKAVDGPNKGREGKVLHIHRRFVFVRQPSILDRGGIFVANANHLQVVGASTRPAANMTGAESPRAVLSRSTGGAAPRGGGGRGRGGRPRRDPLFHKLVIVTSGPHKGKQGIVKDATPTNARIELQSLCRTITVDRQAIKEASTLNRATTSLSTPFGGPQMGGVQHGAQTPLYGAQTPSYGGSRTPHYTGSETPRLGAETPGSRTPGYDYNDSAWNPNVPNTPAPDTPAGRSPAFQQTAEWDVSDVTSEPASVRAETPHAGPATPGQPNTPGDRSYNAAFTPAWESGYSGSTPTAGTPGFGAPATPGTGSTPGMPPATPGTHMPATPGEAVGTSGAGGAPWLVPTVSVRVVSSGQQGTISNVDGGSVSVALDDGSATTAPAEDLTPIDPVKNDRVYVMEGDQQGMRGMLVSIDGVEGVVKFFDPPSLKIIPMAQLTRCAADAAAA